jgi:hypothetical protein
MALTEGTSPVPSADSSRSELQSELRELEKRHDIIGRLRGYVAVVERHAHSDRRSALTLELLRKEKRLVVMVHETLGAAEARLDELEARNDENLDVVLVGTTKVGQLQAAYPNYYANTAVFTDFVESELSA